MRIEVYESRIWQTNRGFMASLFLIWKSIGRNGEISNPSTPISTATPSLTPEVKKTLIDATCSGGSNQVTWTKCKGVSSSDEQLSEVMNITSNFEPGKTYTLEVIFGSTPKTFNIDALVGVTDLDVFDVMLDVEWKKNGNIYSVEFSPTKDITIIYFDGKVAFSGNVELKLYYTLLKRILIINSCFCIIKIR